MFRVSLLTAALVAVLFAGTVARACPPVALPATGGPVVANPQAALGAVYGQVPAFASTGFVTGFSPFAISVPTFATVPVVGVQAVNVIHQGRVVGARRGGGRFRVVQRGRF
jgi:hypothetical protein